VEYCSLSSSPLLSLCTLLTVTPHVRYSFVAGKSWRDSTPEEILQSVEQHPGEASIERCNAIRLVNLLIANSTLSDGECRFGTTKIFLRFRQADILEKERIRYLHASATKIQTIWRMSHQRRDFRRKQKAAISLQAFGKMVIARRCFQQLKAATIILQSVAKMIYARNQYQQVIRPGVVCIHAAARAKLARSFMLKMTWEKIDRARREAEINLTRERKVQKKRKKEEKVRSEKEKVQRELETRAFNNFQRRAEKEQHLAEKKVHEEVAQFVVAKDTPTNYLFDQSQIEEVSHLEALLSTPPQPFLAFPSSYQNVDYKDHLPQLSPSQTEALLASTSSGPTSSPSLSSTSGASSGSSSTSSSSPSTQSRDIQTLAVTRSQNPAPDVDETVTESLTTAVSKEEAPRSSKALPIMSLDTAAVRKATDSAFGRISSKSRSNPQLVDSKSSPRDNIPVKERRRLMPDTLSQLL
jgi:myosin heavy subunit